MFKTFNEHIEEDKKIARTIHCLLEILGHFIKTRRIFFYWTKFKTSNCLIIWILHVTLKFNFSRSNNNNNKQERDRIRIYKIVLFNVDTSVWFQWFHFFSILGNLFTPFSLFHSILLKNIIYMFFFSGIMEEYIINANQLLLQNDKNWQLKWKKVETQFKILCKLRINASFKKCVNMKYTWQN